jgi:hypothetical protein
MDKLDYFKNALEVKKKPKKKTYKHKDVFDNPKTPNKIIKTK